MLSNDVLLRLLYGKCPKVSYMKVSDIMEYTNSADPDQTALLGSTLFAIPLSILRKTIHKKQNLDKKIWNKVFENSGHLQYSSHS